MNGGSLPQSVLAHSQLPHQREPRNERSQPLPSSDERTEVPALPGFGSAPLESAGFAGAGRGLQAARDCFKEGGCRRQTEGEITRIANGANISGELTFFYNIQKSGVLPCAGLYSLLDS